ncbi:hypothetical protein ABZP36_015129 [Zizania latifolia]
MEHEEKDIVISSIPALVKAPRCTTMPMAYGDAQKPYPFSLSMPASPLGFHFSQFGMKGKSVASALAVHRNESRITLAETRFDVHPTVELVEAQSPQPLKQTRFHSQPILYLS